MASPPHIIAHRGAMATHPENTWAALEAAIGGGCHLLEIDIQFDGQGHPWVIHDPTLERTTDHQGALLDYTSEALRQVSAHQPQRFGSQYAPLPLLDLPDLMQALSPHPQLQLFVEIKRHGLARFSADTLVAHTLEALASAPFPVTPISFSVAIVEALQRQGYPRLGWIPRQLDAASAAQAARLQPDYLFFNHLRIAADTPLWPGPWQWVLYDLVEAPAARHWHAQGAWIESADPIGLSAALQRAD